MALLKFILVFFAIYYLVKLIFKNFIKKISSGFENMANPNSASSFYEENKKPEGEITVESTKNKEKKLNKDIGEYTDFEDLKD